MITKSQLESTTKDYTLTQSRLPGVNKNDATLNQSLMRAYKKKGSHYKPRTHHISDDGTPQFINRLIFESSPYLLQHAHNPVNWHAWTDEAFETAKAEHKPILLSIGYSTCHWCHVMEKESFEDVEIARFINENFISIKVDREERPDIDDIYMATVQMMTGHGGWPMTVVLTPDKKPFFGGTYFPARDGDRGSRMGFLSILRELSRLFHEENEKIMGQAEHIRKRLEQLSNTTSTAQKLTTNILIKAAQTLLHSFDGEWGGFGRAPKFPQPSKLSFLLRYYLRTEDPKALEMVSTTLTKMAEGGIHDQIGGGFHRYSVDSKWLVPHFEKMLYDNAQLAITYIEAWQVTKNELFKNIAEQTLEYVSREMTSQEGGFYSATDADSETFDGHEEEGWFFTWTSKEIENLLTPEEVLIINKYYAVTDEGNFEGRNIFHTPRKKENIKKELGLSLTQFNTTLQSANKKLYEHRSTRPKPIRDDKIISAWNGLMISAFAKGSFVFASQTYKEKATKALDFIFNHMVTTNTLHRTYKGGESKHKGFLDDYATLIQACLDVFEIDPQMHWLEKVFSLQEKLDNHFWDKKAGGYFMTSDEHEKLFFRDKPSYDGAIPTGNSIAALNLLRLYQITDNQEFLNKAQKIFAVFSQTLTEHPTALSHMLHSLDFLFDAPKEIIVALANDASSNTEKLLSQLREVFIPNRFMIQLHENQLPTFKEYVPLLKGKISIQKQTTVFVCEEGHCELPTSDPSQLRKLIQQTKPLLTKSSVPLLQ